MTTAWNISSSLPSLAVHRPASLNSLSDLSDNLALGSRPCSASSTLLITPGNFDICGQNTTDHITDSCTCRHHSNISVSFLGSRIKRQYRSSFMLSGDRMIGVTRCETFQPEDAKADIRVNLSLQGPLNMSMVSHSDPGLFPRSPEDNRDWARLMLTTDQPRDSELLGRIGTRNYFSNKESGAPYFHRRIKPIQKEEEYVFKLNLPDEESQSQTVNDAAEGVIGPRSFTVLVTGAGSDVEPSTERVEKDTYPLLSRHHWRPSSAVSAPGRISLSEKELSSPISDSRSPFTQQISDHLPSTERSESIIHLKRTKSETSLSAQSLTSIVTPSLELLHPESAAAPPLRTVKSASEVRVGEQSTSLVDSTFSLHTDFEEEEKAVKCARGAVRREMDREASRVVSSIIPHATVSKAYIFAENTFTSSSPFDSPTNAIVARFGGVGAQECSYIHHGQIPVKSTILHTSLQLNRIVTPETGPKPNLLFPEKMQEGPIGVESDKDVEVLQSTESTEQTPITPLPRKRKRAFQQDGEVEDASQTDESQTITGTSAQLSDQDYYAGRSEKSVGSTPRLPPRPEKRSIRQRDRVPTSLGSGSPSCSTNFCNRESPNGESAELNPNVEELVTHSDDALSHCNPFRSPFDPRSEEDLISSTYERNGGLTSDSTTNRYRHRSEWPKQEETNGLNAYDTGPLPAPRRSMRQGSWADGELPRLAPVMKALKEEMEEGDDYDYDDDDDSWADDESGLRPPALPVNLEAALAELPAEDPAMRTKRLRPLQYPLYVNTTSDHHVVGADIYDRIKFHEGVGPLRTMDQKIPEEELPDTLLIRTRRRTMSGVTGFLPRSSTLSSSSIWFGDHAVPTKTQIYAAEQSPLRLSSIQLQAQAEIARRRSRNNLAARSIISIGDGRSDGTRRSRSLERSRTLGPSSALYGPTGRRVHGGAPIVERAIKRHASKRDGYETLSLVHVPRVDEVPSSITSVTAAEQHKLRRRASSTSVARYGTSARTYQLNCTRNRDKARSLIAQAAVDLAVHTYDTSEV